MVLGGIAPNEIDAALPAKLITQVERLGCAPINIGCRSLKVSLLDRE
jgi:hypothetical protein